MSLIRLHEEKREKKTSLFQRIRKKTDQINTSGIIDYKSIYFLCKSLNLCVPLMCGEGNERTSLYLTSTTFGLSKNGILGQKQVEQV